MAIIMTSVFYSLTNIINPGYFVYRVMLRSLGRWGSRGIIYGKSITCKAIVAGCIVYAVRSCDGTISKV
jgi:hypothetical protein